MSNFPSSWEILRPKTWRNRGKLVGPRTPAARYESGKSPALLAIHGFGGTPREVDLLADVAQEFGLRVAAPLLPGHGTHVRDLGRTRFEDWVGAARAELDTLKREGDVIVLGLSLGACVAARLAEDVPVKGLVLLANALWLQSPYPACCLAIIQHFPVPKSFFVPKLAPDIQDATKRAEHLGYDAQLVAAAVEVYRGGQETQRRLTEIKCPTLLIHGALDKVCPVANVERVIQRLGTKDVRQAILPNSGHIVTRDCDAELVAREFRTFLNELVADGPQTARVL